MFKFRLYVAGNAQNSAQGIAYLSALRRLYPRDRHEVEVVAACREPKRVLADGILMTPTLVKLTPSLSRRIVGTLSHTQPVLPALGLETVAA